jgi:hypothetical protein
MLSRLSAKAYASLMVALYVYEPGQVRVTVQDHVRVDRVTVDAGAVAGAVTGAQRYGGLLPPGTTELSLEPGVYYFRTTGDARVSLAAGAAIKVVPAPADSTPA